MGRLGVEGVEKKSKKRRKGFEMLARRGSGLLFTRVFCRDAWITSE